MAWLDTLISAYAAWRASKENSDAIKAAANTNPGTPGYLPLPGAFQYAVDNTTQLMSSMPTKNLAASVAQGTLPYFGGGSRSVDDKGTIRYTPASGSVWDSMKAAGADKAIEDYKNFKMPEFDPKKYPDPPTGATTAKPPNTSTTGGGGGGMSGGGRNVNGPGDTNDRIPNMYGNEQDPAYKPPIYGGGAFVGYGRPDPITGEYTDPWANDVSSAPKPIYGEDGKTIAGYSYQIGDKKFDFDMNQWADLKAQDRKMAQYIKTNWKDIAINTGEAVLAFAALGPSGVAMLASEKGWDTKAWQAIKGWFTGKPKADGTVPPDSEWDANW